MDKKKFSINVVTTTGASGGHFASYNALRSVIEQRQYPWQLNVIDVDLVAKRLVSKKKVFDLFRLFGTTGDQFVNQSQQNDWQPLQKLTIPLFKLLTKLNYDAAVKAVEELWHEQQPDMVISVLPLYNKIIWESIQRAKPDTPVVTIMTDFADCPPGFWIEPETGIYTICGTEKAVKQARELAVPEKLIIKTSGMAIHPRFYEPIFRDTHRITSQSDRADERKRLGLDPDCLTGVVLFGGCGSKKMLEIAKRLECFQQKLQLIFLCGRNEEVAEALRATESIQNKFVITFTPEIPYYMHLADFFIGKAGPGSITEALVMNLPAIVEHNNSTLAQEKYNAEWIKQKQVGVVISDFKHIKQAVETFLEPENFARYSHNVAAINNRAVFEIPEILQQILATSTKRTVTKSPIANQKN